MQNANTLYYSVSMQRNNAALFVAFSFASPFANNAKTVAQRTAHCVVTLNNKYATTAQIAQLVAQQQQRDKAASVCDCTSDTMYKVLLKNDERAQYA